jgi:hypothetical protein
VTIDAADEVRRRIVEQDKVSEALLAFGMKIGAERRADS